MPSGRRTGIDHTLLEAALAGLEAQRQKVEEQIAGVRSLLGGRTSTVPSAKPARRPRRKMSEEAKKRIAEAQRKRWQAFRRKQASKKR